MSLSIKCPHCPHSHSNERSVELCGLYKQGYRWRDEDGDLANGPYTKPGGGLPRGEVTLQPPREPAE